MQTLLLRDERLLNLAERYYRRLGTLPLNIFAKLVAAGYNVQALEDHWSNCVHV